MKNYLDLMQRILTKGERREDRTGFGTLSLFGESLQFDLSAGFPAVTTKRLAFGQVAAEVACFINCRETLAEFHKEGCKVWDANVNATHWQAKLAKMRNRGVGDGWPPVDWVGQHYGIQWRQWGGDAIDQLRRAVETLRRDPWSRRAVITAWNPEELDEVCLPPCHTMFQLSVRNPGNTAARRLDCAVVMRSVDTFLGMPFDIASYALLVHILAKELDLRVGVLTMWFGDTHIYLNHLDQCREQLSREPRPLPQLAFTSEAALDNFKAAYVSLLHYDPHLAIKADMNP